MNEAVAMLSPELGLAIEAVKKHIKRHRHRLPSDSVPLFVRMMDILLALEGGNQMLEAYWLRAKTENEMLHRLLGALIKQSGGRLQLDEKTWLATDPKERIGARQADNGDSVFLLEGEPVLTSDVPILLERMLKGGWLKDRHPQLPTICELVERGEPIYLPAYNVKTFLPERATG